MIDPYGMRRNDDDYLEDFDSLQGDLEEVSKGATHSASTRHTNSLQHFTSYDASIRRGVMHAEAGNDTTRVTPNGFMEHIINNDDGFSVNTGRMDDMIDTYTFDGSTITSARDLSHKRTGGPIVDWHPNAPTALAPSHSQPAVRKDPAGGSQGTRTSSTYTEKQNEFEARGVFCGLGKIAFVLIVVALLAVALAIILYLLISVIPGNESTPSSPCCLGSFEQDWLGREICNEQSGRKSDLCCVVCSNSIDFEDSNVPDKEKEDKPDVGDDPKPKPPPKSKDTPSPTPGPSRSPSLRPTATPIASVPTHFDATSRPTVSSTPEPTPTPTAAPTTKIPTSPPATPEPTASPTSLIVTPGPSAEPDVFYPDFTVKPTPTRDSSTQTPSISETNTGTSTSSSAGTGTSGVRCCLASEREWGDYLGRFRCPAILDCCEVCPTTLGRLN